MRTARKNRPRLLVSRFTPPIFRLARCAFILLFASSAVARAQQADSNDRVYKHTKVEVEQALQALKAYATNRLPLLDGFVNANATSTAKLENPHYQFRIEIESQGLNQTLVSVSAKITAWSAEDDPSRSQYVVVPSNGRLEQDLLDRLSVFLEKGSAAPSAATEPSGSVSASASPNAPAATGPSVPSHTGDSLPPGPSSSPAASPTARVNPTDPSALARQIAALQAQRQASEANQRRLEQRISELQANASTQRFLSNLAVVKMPRTPVFQQDDDTSKVLFRADPEDEFEVITVKDTWVHIRLENGGDGWIHGAQLQPPGQVDDAEDAAAAINFTTPNQEIKPFGGEWAPLKGKPALFVFAQPTRAISGSILGQSQFQFAKYIFTEGYREATHSEQQMSGVVVIFFGDKGGVAAATLADIRRWRDGAISDKVFFERCSFDPPESFRDAPAPTAIGKH